MGNIKVLIVSTVKNLIEILYIYWIYTNNLLLFWRLYKLETVKKIDEQYRDKLIFDIKIKDKNFVSIQRKIKDTYLDEAKSIEKGKLFQFSQWLKVIAKPICWIKQRSRFWQRNKRVGISESMSFS